MIYMNMIPRLGGAEKFRAPVSKFGHRNPDFFPGGRSNVLFDLSYVFGSIDGKIIIFA